jgi:hypothetical protein
MVFVIFIGLITGVFCMASADGSENNNTDWAYEYEIKPTCYKRSKKRRGSCDGADNMNDFVCNDCSMCEYWGKK